MTVSPPFPDLASLAGQLHAKRALEVAACGGHHLALIGGPGRGKTVVARSLFGLLPPGEHDRACPILEGQEALAWVQGALEGLPGQMQQGVVFLDRLDCYSFSPLQIQRVATVLDRVPQVQLVLTAQPCPCGMFEDPIHECRCTIRLIQRYQWRIRALRERASVTVEIPRLDDEHQMDARAAEGSTSVAARVREGVARQQHRCAGAVCSRNAHLDHAQILRWCELDASAQRLYRAAHQQLHLSGRAADGVLTVARTIADLAGRDRIEAHHVAEALQYQPRL